MYLNFFIIIFKFLKFGKQQKKCIYVVYCLNVVIYFMN